MEIDEHRRGQDRPAVRRAVKSVDAPTVEPAIVSEDRTRDRICQSVLQTGPLSAAELARSLKLTPTAVRRHLDVLLEQGLVAVREAPVLGRRGRGRPARLFVVTDAGHAVMTSGYDDLATQALRFLAMVAGPEAVRRFAAERLAGVEARYRPVVEAAGRDPIIRAEALAEALSVDGYAASARSPGAGAVAMGTQLCQGHCPVHHVAREFPELCEAETDSFSRLLGVHVQRLATLAHGEHVCTTHVPATHVPATPVPATPVPATACSNTPPPHTHPESHSQRSDER